MYSSAYIIRAGAARLLNNTRQSENSEEHSHFVTKNQQNAKFSERPGMSVKLNYENTIRNRNQKSSV